MRGRRGASDLNWPVIAVCGIMAGLAGAYEIGTAMADPHSRGAIQEFFTWHRHEPEVQAREALVITADPKDELTAVATLGPRGYHPLLANCEDQVHKQLEAHPGAIALAIVDARIPEYKSIEEQLKRVLPDTGILVLTVKHRTEEVGPFLLSKL
jgi:hypothetical protein